MIFYYDPCNYIEEDDEMQLDLKSHLEQNLIWHLLAGSGGVQSMIVLSFIYIIRKSTKSDSLEYAQL